MILMPQKRCRLTFHNRLHFNMFRTFDPATGRYLEPDPIGLRGGVHLFLYAHADPLKYTDSHGLSPWSDAREIARYSAINAENSGLPGPARNGPMDAYRHCLWSCLMSREIGGVQTADSYATAHEVVDNILDPVYRGRPVQPWAEFEMDMFNNQAGRATSLQCLAQGQSCEAGCKDALVNGRLFYLSTPAAGWPPSAPDAYNQSAVGSSP
jgi:RHS repeat-associated protein